MLEKPWGRFVQVLLYSEVPTVAGLVSLMETLWWACNGIPRVLAHEVKTTSSGSIGWFPICLPTQFSHHKKGQASLELKHGQFHTKPILCPINLALHTREEWKREDMIQWGKWMLPGDQIGGDTQDWTRRQADPVGICSTFPEPSETHDRHFCIYEETI